ncbi:hypothetical protein IT084_17555 [Desulfallas sp. Bu1-1]|nr:hypothetical protein [Desulfallas sp. Bu1-1]
MEQIAGEIAPPAGPYSVKTMWRWKQRWDKFLAGFDTPVWALQLSI